MIKATVGFYWKLKQCHKITKEQLTSSDSLKSNYVSFSSSTFPSQFCSIFDNLWVLAAAAHFGKEW